VASLNFADRIITWQKQHGRHELPWQRTKDAYRIWLSEIMLQQTQVTTVIPYYEKFVAHFPDVNALAAAPIESVMQCWAGLGYYSRARNLHRCAQLISSDHGGKFPRQVETLAKLPGVGRSTAAAIAALAFGERAAILDGNVRRVLARHCGIEGYPGRSKIERQFWQCAESLLPINEIEPYTQGMMDLGATVCTRIRPNCAACPVNETCVAHSTDTVDNLPTPRPVRQRPVRAQTLLAMQDSSGAVLLELRPPSGIWGGLLSLPEFESGASDEVIVAEVGTRFGLDISITETLGDIRHEFTHYTYLMRPRLAQIIGAVGVASAPLRRVSGESLGTAPLPAPVRRLLLHVMKPVLV
jgi:A/G-specific adenine glycosylase